MTTLNYFKNEPNAQEIKAGETIFDQGELADVMYVVREGEVDIVVGDKVVEKVGVGGIFGEMALIDNSPRSASCVARTDCKIIPVNQHWFVYMVQETPYFALQVMGIMAERLRRTSSALSVNQ